MPRRDKYKIRKKKSSKRWLRKKKLYTVLSQWERIEKKDSYDDEDEEVIALSG